ncbi:MAG: serine/threonine-protein kinase [Deltaproteobacteria bacterium]|nr:serine/threonine-protein kinase [Deltaproteobacteria bacterium]
MGAGRRSDDAPERGPEGTPPDDPESPDESPFSTRSGVLPNATVATHSPGAIRAGAPILSGTKVGRYVVLDLLGRGGMGVVYRAWDPELSRAVALKLVDTPHRIGAVRDRLLREAQALAQLSHPNVVAIHDVGTTADALFIAMECVEGETAIAWLKAKPRTPREILAVYLAAGEGLAAAHAVGLIHRDFKPANVVIGEDGRARVLDFGLARAIDAPTPSSEARDEPVRESPGAASSSRLDTPLTQAGAIMGTPRYMAPEQHAGEPASPQSDQFAFCVALWEALFGVRAFVADDRAALRMKMETGELNRPAGAKVSAAIERMMRRGLSPRPGDRFPSVAALLVELRRDPARRRRQALVVGGAAVVAVVLGAGWLRGRGAEPEPCAADPTALAGVWDGGRRAATRAAFDASGAASAADAYARVAVALDRYAQAWTGMRLDACRATRVRGEQSEHLLDLRIQCLDRRRDGLRALVDVFARSDRGVVDKAIEAARSLAPLDGCADGAALGAAVPPPGAAQARVAEVQRALAHVGALFAAGRYADGLIEIDAITRDAAQLAYPPLIAEAALRRGGLRDRTGDYAGAEQEFWAAAIAADTGRVDEIRAEALTQLAWVIGERLGRYPDARRIAALAHGAIDRLDRPERALAKYHRVIGVFDYQEGKYADALRSSQQAAELAQRAYGPDDPYVASCVMDVGLALFYLGEYARARTEVTRALALWRAVYGPDHEDVAAALNNLGEIYRAEHRLPEASDSYRAAAAIWERRGSVDLATALENIGDIEREQGALGPADADLRQALAVTERALGREHPRVAEVLVRHGRVLVEQRAFEPAVAELTRALQILDAQPGDPLERAECQFALARGLRGLAQPATRSQDLALAAVTAFTAAGPRAIDRVAAVWAWLASP